jgi:hypothetical protein
MDSIKYLFEILWLKSWVMENYGMTATIIVCFLFVILWFFKVKWMGTILSAIQEFILFKLIKSKSKEVKEISISESDVENHDIFNYIDFWRYSKIPAMQYTTDFRTAVFRKYLQLYLKSYKDNLSEFVTSGDFKNMDNNQLWVKFLELMNDIIYDYENDMRDIGIPQIIIEKMKVKNNDTINLIIDLMEGICNSTFYNSENNLLKVYSILNIILSVLENTISHSQSTCNSINGQLKGLVFVDGGKIIKET